MAQWEELLQQLGTHLRLHDRRLALLNDLDREILKRTRDLDPIVRDTIRELVDILGLASALLLKGSNNSLQFDTRIGGPPGELGDHWVSLATVPQATWLQVSEVPQLAPLLASETAWVSWYQIGRSDECWGAFVLGAEEQPDGIDTGFAHAVLQQMQIALRDLASQQKLEQFRELHTAFFAHDLDQNKCLQILAREAKAILSGEDPLLIQILFVDEASATDDDVAPASERNLRIRWSSTPTEIGVVVPLESFSGSALLGYEEFRVGDPADPAIASLYKSFASFPSRTELAIKIGRDHSVPLGILNIESPRSNAFSVDEISRLVDLVDLVSPVIVAVRRRVGMARLNRAAAQYALGRYLKNLSFLFSHKFTSRTEALKFSLATIIQRIGGDHSLDGSLRTLREEYTWLECELTALWAELETVATIDAVHVHEIVMTLLIEDPKIAAKYLDVDNASLIALPPVRASRLLKEHLRNLILNAVRAVDDKAMESAADFLPRVRVSGVETAIRQTGTTDVATDEIAALNRRVRIVIEDNGVGIPQEHLVRVFQHGFSTRGTSGYGLSGARDYARELGGDVRIASTLGQGCRVLIELPVFVTD